MDRTQIHDLTETILVGAAVVDEDPKVEGSYVVVVENEKDDFRMAVTDEEGLPYEFELLVEGGVALAVAESEEQGWFKATVAVKRHGEIISATYTVTEFQL